jgi:uncharacterized membrane protein YccC
MNRLGLVRSSAEGGLQAGRVRGTVERLESEIKTELTSITFSDPVARLAFRTALASSLAILAAMALDLDAPFWAGITAFGMVQHDVSATLLRSFDRVLGTIAGAVLGYIGAAAVADHAIFFILSMTVVSFMLYAQARADHGYAVVLMGATFLLVMFGSLSMPSSTLSLAVYRGLEIFVGVAAAGLVDILLASDRVHWGSGQPKPGIFSRPVDVGLLVVALTGGIAVASVPAIWDGLELPGIDQTPITAIVIAIAIQRDAQWTGALRIFGCCIGGVYGLLCVHIVGESFVLWLGLLFLGLYFSSHILQRGGDASYMGHQAGVAVILAMVQGRGPSTSILPAIDRIVGTFGGIVLVTVFQVLLAPVIRRCVLAAIRLAASTN